MLEKNPLFLFPKSYFGSSHEFEDELQFPDWDPSCGFFLELQKPDFFPEKIGPFIHWTEFSSEEIFTDFSSEETDLDA